MYADTITKSMRKAIDETNRRRKIQEEYNIKNGITPTSITKVVPEDGDWRESVETQGFASKKHEKDFCGIPKDEARKIIKTLEKKMDIAARNLQFEIAAELRDEIEELMRFK